MAPKGKSKGKGKQTHRKTNAVGRRILPMNVLSAILVRLPIKSLLRFKCVSTQWRKLVSRPAFISQHLTRYPALLLIHAATSPILPTDEALTDKHIDDVLKEALAEEEAELNANEAQPQPDAEEEEARVIEPDGHLIALYEPPNPQSTIARILDHPGSDVAGFDFLEVIGSTPTGIVLIAQGRFATTLTLWNPATRSARRIPHPGIQPDLDRHRVANIGLAFDPARNDYKVVRIVCHRLTLNTPDVAEVFSLRSGRWGPVPRPDFMFWVAGEKCGAVIDGVPYWACVVYDQGRERTSRMLLSFDVNRGAFAAEPFGWVARDKEICLGEIREGCLGAVVWDWGSEETENHQDIDVWVRERGGGWTIVCREKRLPAVRRKVVGFYGEMSGIVVEDGDEGTLSMLSLESLDAQDFRNFPGSVPESFTVVNYRKSLHRIPEMGTTIV